MARRELDTRAFKSGQFVTTIGIETEFWESLEFIAQCEGKPVRSILQTVDAARKELSRASAIRTFVARYLLEYAHGSAGLPVPAPCTANAVSYLSKPPVESAIDDATVASYGVTTEGMNCAVPIAQLPLQPDYPLLEAGTT